MFWSPLLPFDMRPVMKPQAAGETSTAAGMPPVSSIAANASAGQASPAGDSSWARSTASDQVASIGCGQPSMTVPAVFRIRSAYESR